MDLLNIINTGIIKKIITTGLFAWLVFYGCQPASRYKILSALFDGVPEPNSGAVVTDSTKTDKPPAPGTKSKINSTDNRKFIHAVFRMSYCGKCHDSGKGHKLLEKEPELCYFCHDDYRNMYKFLHGPVLAGMCTSCHNPHQSDYPNLLDRYGTDLCMYCHQAAQLPTDQDHDLKIVKNCLPCHNTHGADNTNLLTKSGGEE